MTARTIRIPIDGAGGTRCDDCEHLHKFTTGLIGEFHMTCKVFDISGRWGELNMKRPKACLNAEKMK